jgi:hypothetical protein
MTVGVGFPGEGMKYLENQLMSENIWLLNVMSGLAIPVNTEKSYMRFRMSKAVVSNFSIALISILVGNQLNARCRHRTVILL